MSSAPKDGELEALKGLDKNEHSLRLKMSDLEFLNSSIMINTFSNSYSLFTHLCSKLQHIPRENFSQLRIISRTLDPMKLWEPTNQKNIAPHEIAGTDKLVGNGNP